MSSLLPLVGGGIGAFHVWQENGQSFSFHQWLRVRGESDRKSFAAGEGIAGQAAAERKLLILTDLPKDYIRISSGMGESPARVLAAVPLLARERVLGILEVASFVPLSGPQRELLDEVAAMVALKLEVLQRNLRTRDLLERIRETEQFFRSVLELAPDGLMVVGTNGVIQLANAQCEKLFGYTSEELVGSRWRCWCRASCGRHPGLREGFHGTPTPRAMGAGP